MYENVVKELQNLLMAYKATDNENCHQAKILADAVDAIENTSKAYQMMTEAYEAEVTKPLWIPVSERLPKEEETVLTWGKEHQCILLDWMHDNKWCCFGGADYWMPLPEPPEEK